MNMDEQITSIMLVYQTRNTQNQNKAIKNDEYILCAILYSIVAYLQHMLKII